MPTSGNDIKTRRLAPRRRLRAFVVHDRCAKDDELQELFVLCRASKLYEVERCRRQADPRPSETSPPAAVGRPRQGIPQPRRTAPEERRRPPRERKRPAARGAATQLRARRTAPPPRDGPHVGAHAGSLLQWQPGTRAVVPRAWRRPNLP